MIGDRKIAFPAKQAQNLEGKSNQEFYWDLIFASINLK